MERGKGRKEGTKAANLLRVICILDGTAQRRCALSVLMRKPLSNMHALNPYHYLLFSLNESQLNPTMQCQSLSF